MIVKLYEKINELIGMDLETGDKLKLGGSGKTVEVDASFFLKIEFPTARIDNSTDTTEKTFFVIGMKENNSNLCFFQVIH